MKYLDSRPERASGALTIKGTRIRVAHLLKLVVAGMSYSRSKLNGIRTFQFQRFGALLKKL